jgi:primase-polymerase (primpol)-like protein
MTIIPANIPEELIALPQWVLWRYEARVDDPTGKPTKVPYQAHGHKASDTNPRHWTRFDYVFDVWERQLVRSDGIGFVLSADDDFTGIDLDDVWQSDSDEGAPWGIEILERFADSYLEESPSGHGVKIWCRARLSHGGRGWKVGHGAIEIYDRSRYFTVTGNAGPARVITDHQADVESLIENLNGGPRASTRPVTTINGQIPYGVQHNTLVSLAGTMWRRGMSVSAIV